MKPPEKVKHELLHQWLEKAKEDFELANHLVSENAPYLGAVGFHAQQAAEKYIKAFLVSHQIEFPKSHDLDELLDLVATVSTDLATSLRDVIILTDYGVDIRYPGNLPAPTPGEAKRAVDLARKVRDAILRSLPASEIIA